MRHFVAFTSTSFDGTLDVVIGHTLRTRGLDRAPEPRVAIRISTAGLCRNTNFFRQFAKNLAAFRVNRAFETLDLRPLAMSRHKCAEYFKTAKFA